MPNSFKTCSVDESATLNSIRPRNRVLELRDAPSIRMPISSALLPKRSIARLPSLSPATRSAESAARTTLMGSLSTMARLLYLLGVMALNHLVNQKQSLHQIRILHLQFGRETLEGAA